MDADYPPTWQTTMTRLLTPRQQLRTLTKRAHAALHVLRGRAIAVSYKRDTDETAHKPATGHGPRYPYPNIGGGEIDATWLTSGQIRGTGVGGTPQATAADTEGEGAPMRDSSKTADFGVGWTAFAVGRLIRFLRANGVTDPPDRIVAGSVTWDDTAIRYEVAGPRTGRGPHVVPVTVPWESLQ